MQDHTANPNATPGAGYGTPIKKDDGDGMKDFMRSIASYQEARNLAATASNKSQEPQAQGQATKSRTISFLPAVHPAPAQSKNYDTRKHLAEGIKPFAFALGRTSDGATIWWGLLLAKVTTVFCTREDGFITSITQPPIQTTDSYPVGNPDADTTKPIQLDWFGAVYLYWECDENGAITAVEIKGPDLPDGQDIGELSADLTREITDGRFYVLIGTVPEDGPIDQQISSDVPWFPTIFKGTDTPGSGGSEGSTGSSAGSSGGSTGSFDPGSDKSTAIVPVTFHSTGYAALFTMEAPDVRFEDVVQIHPKRRKFKFQIDPRFVEVCEKDSIAVLSCFPSSPAVVGATVKGNIATFQVVARKIPETLTIKLSGIRRGFKGMRFPTRTEAQFLANEKFLNSAYPRK